MGLFFVPRGSSLTSVATPVLSILRDQAIASNGWLLFRAGAQNGYYHYYIQQNIGGDKYSVFTILNVGRTYNTNCKFTMYYINTISPLFSSSFLLLLSILFSSIFLFRPRFA